MREKGFEIEETIGGQAKGGGVGNERRVREWTNPPGKGPLGEAQLAQLSKGGSDDHEENEGVGDDNADDCDMVDVARGNGIELGTCALASTRDYLQYGFHFRPPANCIHCIPTIHGWSEVKPAPKPKYRKKG